MEAGVLSKEEWNRAVLKARLSDRSVWVVDALARMNESIPPCGAAKNLKMAYSMAKLVLYGNNS